MSSTTKNDKDYGEGGVVNPATGKKEWKINKAFNKGYSSKGKTNA